MEVMQGQDINPQSELMDKLEEQAINSTGISVELLNARLALDFATQLTMSNVRFMRFTFKRQAKMELHLSNIITDIYNTEYAPDTPIMVRCVLPMPIMLNINNLSQLIQLIQQQAQSLSEIEYPNANEQDVDVKRGIFIQMYVRHKLGSYMKQNELDAIKAKVDLQYNIQKTPTEEEQ